LKKTELIISATLTWMTWKGVRKSSPKLNNARLIFTAAHHGNAIGTGPVDLVAEFSRSYCSN